MILNNLALIICIIGGAVFLFIQAPEKPRTADFKALAKDAFWVGLFIFLLQGAHVVIK